MFYLKSSKQDSIYASTVLGIDDMFVIMQCWENVVRDPTSKELPTPEKVGLSLRHAGVSITVTSLTDIFAFAAGALTRMPGLQSFCVCTAIGLASVYLLTVTWFTAWLAMCASEYPSWCKAAICPTSNGPSFAKERLLFGIALIRRRRRKRKGRKSNAVSLGPLQKLHKKIVCNFFGQ